MSAPGRIRTCDLLLRRQSLYPLSYGRGMPSLGLAGHGSLGGLSRHRRLRALDAGEGAQRQMINSTGLVQVDDIYITHFHADHYLGLPGMLKTFALRQRERTLTVYGPVGLERLFRVLPDLSFRIKHVAVSGWPWATTVVVEWRDFATLAGGARYVNDGAHAIQIHWGKVVVLHAYLDTQIMVDAMRTIAAAGVAEAVAPKIED